MRHQAPDHPPSPPAPLPVSSCCTEDAALSCFGLLIVSYVTLSNDLWCFVVVFLNMWRVKEGQCRQLGDLEYHFMDSTWCWCVQIEETVEAIFCCLLTFLPYLVNVQTRSCTDVHSQVRHFQCSIPPCACVCVHVGVGGGGGYLNLR